MTTSHLSRWMQSLRLRSPGTAAEEPHSRKVLVVNGDSSTASSSTTTTTETPTSRTYLARPETPQVPAEQHQLLIYAPKEPFKLKGGAEVPGVRSTREILIRVDSIGLNPIDWKSPAFGWGLPGLPCVLGRDYMGTVVEVPGSTYRIPGRDPARREIQPGDVVLAISTDYRDYRKAAFQQYSIAQDFNVCRIPQHLRDVSTSLPAIGVAFVTAALSLGVCLGLSFQSVVDTPGPDLYQVVHDLERNSLPEDIRDECFDSMPSDERIQAGDWIAVWGASTTVGFFTVQLAKRAGLRVVAVADLTSQSASKLVDLGADIVVHRADQAEAARIIISLTKGKNLRYGVDSVGKDTAKLLESTFHVTADSADSSGRRAAQHLVCLVGSPKLAEGESSSSKYHKLPMKIFHESPAVGLALMEWLEDLLWSDRGLTLPEIEIHESKGLQSISEALERLRDDRRGGQRIVVEM